ncbi:hypothetical protein LEP1GSC074_2024 [Leptospira noguchii str. Hook]|nr:hypothetical protein LEP1GSC074_2024 [Leptospira noguchii str. Hook]
MKLLKENFMKGFLIRFYFLLHSFLSVLIGDFFTNCIWGTA